MRGLLAVERMVLESVSKHKTKIGEIAKDTALSEMFVKTILTNLKEHGLIIYKKGKYLLRKDREILGTFNQSHNVKYEVKDLFGSLVDNYFAESSEVQTLKMQKIWLTDLEFKIMKSMMSNMENYIKSIRKDRLLNPEEEVLSEQRVIFWGADTYSNLINSSLRAA